MLCKLLNEDGYVIVAMMPRLINDCDTVSFLSHRYSIKKADIMNYMLKSPIAFLNTPNIYNLTWASLPLVQTKKVDMWTSLKKYVEKYYSSKSGLELGKRCVVNLLRFQFCFSDSNVKHKGDIVSSLKCLGLLPDRLSYITSLTFS